MLSTDNNIKQWKVSDGSWEGHIFWVTSLVLSSEGPTLYSGSIDNNIKQWKVSDSGCINTLEGHSSWVTSLMLSSDGQTLYSGSWDNSIKQWNVSDGSCINTLEGHGCCDKPDVVFGWSDIVLWVLGQEHQAIECVGRQLRLYSGSWDNSIKQWNVSDGSCINTLEGHGCDVTSLMLSSDGQTLYSGSWDKSIKQLNVSDAAEGTIHKDLKGEV